MAEKKPNEKKIIESIKNTNPELSAHDITIAVSSPKEEKLDNYDDIERLVAEVENEDEKKAERKAERKEKKAAQTKAEEKAKQHREKIDKKESRAKHTLPYRIFSAIIAFITLGSLVAIIVRVAMTNTVPAKFFWPSVAVAILFCIFFIFKCFRRYTHVVTLTILNIIGILLVIASAFCFIRINELMNFFEDNLGEKTEYTVYNIFVRNDSEYNSLSDVRGQVFHTISTFTDTEKLELATKEQANATLAYEDYAMNVLNNVLSDNKYIGLLNSGTYESTIDTSISSSTNEQGENKNTSAKIKIIGEIKVEASNVKIDTTSNLTNQSFTMFISGIDTRSDQMVSNSLSDVNIVMTVNPTTHKILLVAIPRDYYVQLHGTFGLPDKLTHAGSLGGLNLSMATIEDLLDIQFNQYLRVNFNAVVNLVNAIGGITVYSDVDYDITAWTNKSCVFHPGDNKVNGECALAFARERYAYSSGDRHRGENQEQVIEKIFTKITRSSTLVAKYMDILNALSGSFETSITTADLTGLVNMQLDEMPTWEITDYNLNGNTGSALTYSYPNQYLSVMFPDYSTVETAKQKIQETLRGTAK